MQGTDMSLAESRENTTADPFYVFSRSGMAQKRNAAQMSEPAPLILHFLTVTAPGTRTSALLEHIIHRDTWESAILSAVGDLEQVPSHDPVLAVRLRRTNPWPPIGLDPAIEDRERYEVLPDALRLVAAHKFRSIFGVVPSVDGLGQVYILTVATLVNATSAQKANRQVVDASRAQFGEGEVLILYVPKEASVHPQPKAPRPVAVQGASEPWDAQVEVSVEGLAYRNESVLVGYSYPTSKLTVSCTLTCVGPTASFDLTEVKNPLRHLH